MHSVCSSFISQGKATFKDTFVHSRLPTGSELCTSTAIDNVYDEMVWKLCVILELKNFSHHKKKNLLIERVKPQLLNKIYETHC